MARQQSRSSAPSDAELRAQLGPAHSAYRALLDGHPALTPEWKWYGKKNGWSLKLLDGKRNLCFIGPHEGYFNAGFVFGHDAVNRALESESLPADIKRLIADAPTLPEGRGFRLEVRDESLLPAISHLLEIKRGPKPATAAHERAAQGHSAREAAVPRPPSAPRADLRMPSHRRGRG